MEEESLLVGIHPDHLLHIFGFLQPDDLLKLALTCTTLKNLIYEFCSTKLNHDLPSLEEFFNNEGYLTPKEKKLKKIMNGYKSPLMIQTLSKSYSNRLRVSCTDVDTFPHSTNPSYFEISEDEVLKHNIVTLKDVCWLEIRHKFKAVKPGKYKAAMRIKFTENFHWPTYNNENVRIKAHWSEYGNGDKVECDREVIFSSSDWKEIKKMVEEEKVFEGLPPEGRLVNCDKELGWFDFQLSDPIEIHKETDLGFIFQDVKNNGWKSGIAFDYIELAPIIV